MTALTPPKIISQQAQRLSKRYKKRVIRYSLLSANLALLLAVGGFVVNSHQTSNSSQPTAYAVANATTVNPLDQLSSSDIAVNVAQVSGLAEMQDVKNNADSLNAQLAVSSTDQKVIAKPQVISAGLKSRKDIQKYVVKPGDTVTSIATQFSVTSDTIRWSNNIPGDSVTAGKELLISPVNGIVYQVNSGDTVDGLADKYRANKELLIAINDAEAGLPVGQNIVIPDGSPPSTRIRVVGGSNASYGGFAPAYGGNNGYAAGNCTWWAADRRARIGKPIPNNLGNASTWKVLAQRAGMSVGTEPAAGAIVWFPPANYYGHVAFVESVGPDGTVNISEMNVAGLYSKTYRALSPAEASRVSYIY